MLALTNKQKQEFIKTFDFINLYIGGAVHQEAKSINEIYFDNHTVGEELKAFVAAFRKSNTAFETDSPSAQYCFSKYNELQKINALFNNSTKERKNDVMTRLYKYCASRNLQPRFLRVDGFKTYEVRPIKYSDQPIVTVYE